MRKRIAKKVLRYTLLGEAEGFYFYNSVTIEQAIRRLNPSVWRANWEKRDTWVSGCTAAYHDEKIRQVLTSKHYPLWRAEL